MVEQVNHAAGYLRKSPNSYQNEDVDSWNKGQFIICGALSTQPVVKAQHGVEETK